MGMESGKILDKQITASSEWRADHAAHQGRLNFQEVVEGGVRKTSGSWSALIKNQNQCLFDPRDIDELVIHSFER